MKQNDERREKFDKFVNERYPDLDPKVDELFINVLYEAYLIGCKHATADYNDTLNEVLDTLNKKGL